MIYLFTGNGKGKTTAAIGQAVRALGNGKSVAFIQFIKSPKRPTGEEAALKEFGKRCKVYKGGRGFVGIMGDSLPSAVHKDAARKTWEEGKKCIKSGKFGLVILDEINVALALKLLSLREVFAFLKKTSRKNDKNLWEFNSHRFASRKIYKKNRMENHMINHIIPDIILTGRSAPKEFIEIADFVTECKEIKHPFQKGKRGEQGREY